MRTPLYTRNAIPEPDDSGQIVCPTCSSPDVQRIRRSRLEKIFRANPKFRCLRCRRRFYRKLEPANNPDNGGRNTG